MARLMATINYHVTP